LIVGFHFNLQDLVRLRIGKNVREVFDFDLVSETTNQAALKKAIKDSETNYYYVSQEFLINASKTQWNTQSGWKLSKI
jgi:bacterioferritin (cytochrome b1)